MSSDGTLLGVCDFYIDQYATAGEFDGMQKYSRAFYERTGRLEKIDLGEIVWREKRREDSLRDEGNEVVRVVWSELDGRDGMVRARFLRAFARSTQRRTIR